MRAALRRLVITFSVTALLLLGGASLLYAQTPMPTPAPETPEERHVGLWLADWQRIPITFPNGTALSQIIDWSADGERLLLSTYNPNSAATEPFFAFFALATGEVTPISAGSPPTLANIPIDPVWDQEHQAIVYLQYRESLTSTINLAEVVAIDEAGNLLREFTSILLTNREMAAHLISEGHTELADFPSADDISLNSNGRVSVLKNDRIVTMRMGETDRTIALPFTITQRMNAASQEPESQRFPPKPELWVSPNAEHYALAITRTLSLYRSEDLALLHEFVSPCPSEYAIISFPTGFEWSQDSRSYYFQFVGGTGFVYPCATYIQRVENSTGLPISQSLPSIPGNIGAPTAMTLHPTGPWLVLFRPSAAQCAGFRGYGCVDSQILVDRYGIQTPIIWWSADSNGAADWISLWDRGVWSPTERRWATGCSHYSWIDGDLTSESAICFFDFSWEKPAVDPCQRPLAENLYCGDPDDHLP